MYTRQSRNPEFLPWHQLVWERLQRARRAERLPHALLFSGQKGLGKQHLARFFAQSLLCDSPDEKGFSCGHCRGCHLFRAETHPDFRWVEPAVEAKSPDIKIDAIRAITTLDALTAQSGGYKVTVITPAEQMNTAAANALLKSLEEPFGASVMILISAHPSRLPATIRSRCQRLRFAIPHATQARGWLQRQQIPVEQLDLALGLAGGAPLAALSIANTETLSERAELLEQFLGIIKENKDPVAIVEDWMSRDINRILGWMSGWLIDMLRLQTRPTAPALSNPDQEVHLGQTAKGLEPRRLHRLLQDVLDANRSISTNLNAQLMLERLLISWSKVPLER